MGRALPDYDPERDGPYASSRRRREIFKRVYRKREHWRALQEDQGMEQFITTPDGEDIYYGDLMVGIDTLPEQQRKAFELICLREYTESAAMVEILPMSRWSTTVQQYSDDGLKKMITAYDAVQARTWNPAEAKSCRRRPKRKGDVVAAAEAPTKERPKLRRVDYLDWSICSEDNESLATFINEKTGLGITGQMVKAVAFLRKEWYHSPEQVAHREEEAQRKEAEKQKYAYETPEQREKRFEAARRLKAAEAAAKRAQELQDEVRELRIAAGLDPDTGEPADVVA